MPTVIDGSLGVTYPVTAGGTSAVQASSSKILQVVSATYSTNVSTSSGTPVTTGVTATITPTSANSKILINAVIEGSYNNANSATGTGFYIYKNGSNLTGSYFTFTNYLGSATALIMSVPMTYLDSPATTSSTTYAIFFARLSGSGSVVVQQNNDISSITLMEIAA